MATTLLKATNWACPVILPMIVITEEYNAFILQDNIIDIFPNNIESPYRFKCWSSHLPVFIGDVIEDGWLAVTPWS